MDQNTEMEQNFLALYDQFANPIFRHCYFRVSSREIAEDLTQETFMRIWNYLREGKIVNNPRAFLYRIAGNLVIDYYRKKKEVSLEALSEEGLNPVGDDASSIVNYAAGQHMLSLVAKMEPAYREILILRYVDGLPLSEIAAIVEETENAVSVRIHRAIAKLKKLSHYEKSD